MEISINDDDQGNAKVCSNQNFANGSNVRLNTNKNSTSKVVLLDTNHFFESHTAYGLGDNFSYIGKMADYFRIKFGYPE